MCDSRVAPAMPPCARLRRSDASGEHARKFAGMSSGTLRSSLKAMPGSGAAIGEGSAVSPTGGIGDRFGIPPVGDRRYRGKRGFVRRRSGCPWRRPVAAEISAHG